MDANQKIQGTATAVGLSVNEPKSITKGGQFAGEVLRARPVKGEVDHVALIREHMARYPNIIAALARAEQRCAERKRKG